MKTGKLEAGTEKCEYLVKELSELTAGVTDTSNYLDALQENLNKLGDQGWKLKTNIDLGYASNVFIFINHSPIKTKEDEPEEIEKICKNCICFTPQTEKMGSCSEFDRHTPSSGSCKEWGN